MVMRVDGVAIKLVAHELCQIRYLHSTFTFNKGCLSSGFPRTRRPPTIGRFQLTEGEKQGENVVRYLHSRVMKQDLIF